MSKFVREVTVICQEDQPGTIYIETTDRIDPLFDLIDKIQHCLSAIGIADSAENTHGLVEHEIDRPSSGAERYWYSIDAHVVHTGINL